MKSVTTLLFLAAVAKASPVAKTSSLVPRTDWAIDDKDRLCGEWDLTTPEGVDELWHLSGAETDLELFIKVTNKGEESWVQKLESWVMQGTDGKSGAPGCSLIGTECNPMRGISCKEQFDKYGETLLIGRSSYWMFQAVKGVHAKFAELHRQLTTETLINGLKIDKMIEDFSGDGYTPGNVKPWLSAAATMGNALGGTIPGSGSVVSAGMGLFAGIMSGLSVSDEDEDPSSTIKDRLADLFKDASKKLEDTLRIVTGGGSEDEYNALPAPKDDHYESKISKFFNGGWFLLDDNTKTVTETLNSITSNIQKKVANDVMKSAKLHLVADKLTGASDSREACGYNTGRQWLPLRDGEEYCFYIMRNNPDPNREGEWTEVGSDIYEKMADFGLGDREPYYNALIDCALNGDPDKLEVNTLDYGKAPTCFFNMPVVFVEKDDSVGCGDLFSKSDCDYRKGTPVS
ncbi:hypothetical protein FSPOR_8016 [Fusarium sporotrichioides]|jgi:hypothetical protein|uniref:Uncharacterized protein n=1 Tax=Fusarium sporotrichioides TaxID=5514 RepID=A0A395RVL8_FUSSP|nr:hypothetical protein FSPOR_8016 [Fusarium sporotrichioides]